MMGFIWFWLVAVMIVGYVVLDGFDLGVGVLHLFLVRNEAERQATLRSIGPVWDGNEVWLLAGGGTLYFAFPLLYASAFSGFYLPLMIVLWLLILRGVSLELRNHSTSACGARCSTASSASPAPCSPSFTARRWPTCCAACRCRPTATSFCRLWTNWQPGAQPGILDWYTVIGGLVALVALTLHGALWLTIKTSGDLEQRARKHRHAALAAAGGAHRRQPHRHHRRAPGEPRQLLSTIRSRSSCRWAWLHRWSASGSGTAKRSRSRPFSLRALYLFFMLAGACWGLYPTLLPATTGADNDITLSRALSGPHTLAVGLVWWIFGMALAVGYMVFVYSRFKGKVDAHGEWRTDDLIVALNRVSVSNKPQMLSRLELRAQS